MGWANLICLWWTALKTENIIGLLHYIGIVPVRIVVCLGWQGTLFTDINWSWKQSILFGSHENNHSHTIVVMETININLVVMEQSLTLVVMEIIIYFGSHGNITYFGSLGKDHLLCCFLHYFSHQSDKTVRNSANIILVKFKSIIK